MGGLMRTTYRKCKYCGEFHATNAWPDNHRDPPKARSHLSAPMIDRDGLDDLWHPHNGQLYDSKSAFRAATKAAGGEEVGNETQTDNRVTNKVTHDEVAQAVSMVSQGYKPKTTETASEGWS